MTVRNNTVIFFVFLPASTTLSPPYIQKKNKNVCRNNIIAYLSSHNKQPELKKHTAMNYGKKICRQLKAIRKKIADANGISYSPSKCNHRGDCAGTCPACDAELRYIERELSLRRLAGKAAVVTGLSVGLASLSSCHKIIPQPSGKMIDPKEYRLEGDVMMVDSTQSGDSAAAASPGTTDKKAQP